MAIRRFPMFYLFIHTISFFSEKYTFICFCLFGITVTMAIVHQFVDAKHNKFWIGLV